jgi:hypothetical protein
MINESRNFFICFVSWNSQQQHISANAYNGL